MKKLFYTFILVILQINAQAQSNGPKDNFVVKIREEEGDLNKDGIKDKALIMMDTVDETVPLKLKIYLSQHKKKPTLFFTSTGIIEPMYPVYRKGLPNEYQIPYFFIEDGYLKMISETKGGQAEHRFRFINGNFELVYFSKSTWDGKNTTTLTEFNLISGWRTEITQGLDSEKILTKKKSKSLIRPLPKIQTFKHFEKNLY